ncbi:hypothetical protein COLO4_10915 [Corchorus olitorius]|uniref:DUF4378 domain-containing protein n=1 Tax=Corchorus olitorius TaxID=93759 RepID=A0A1R3K6E4_9ROSI|nr:hypothetical protein COLO4_10915 [Corchorus olitorius]
MESKPTTPSVIARLMGLDSLPNQQAVKQQKVQRVLSENYRRKVASIGAWEKRSFVERRSYRFNIEEQKEFKDVYEVIQSLGKESDSSAEKGRLDFKLSQEKVPFFSGSLEAEYVPAGIKCRPSKEVHSEHSWFGFADSRNYFQKSGYMTTKHFYDQDGVSSHLLSGHVNRKHAPDGTPRFHLEANNERRPSFRKIVVLKPKAGEAENATNCISSPSTIEGSYSGNRKDKGFLSHGKGNSNVQVERKNLSNVVKFTGHRSAVSCETEKEITSKTRHNISGISLEPPRSGFSGVHCLNEETQITMVSSPNYIGSNNWYKPSNYYLDGSYVAQEAKKQISERCRMTKEFRENGLAAGGSGKRTTLGEMLALPDNGKHTNSHTPVGISSKDGWNKRGVGDLLKSRSPTDSTSVESPKTRTSHKAFSDDSFMTVRPVFSPNRSRLKSSKQSSSKKDGVEQRDSESNCIKSPSSPQLEPEKNDLLEDKYVVHDMLKNNLEKQDPPEQNSMESKSLEHDVVCIDSGSKIISTVELKDIKDGNMSAEGSSEKEDLSMEISEECGRDLDALANLETAYQPSPVSVLESPFGEDTLSSLSSSECFHNVSASLHDVRRQLEFLKSESFERDSEEPGMVVSSDDEAGDESLEDCEVNEDSISSFGVEEGRDFSYIVDVLTEAGFQSRNQDKAFDGWHSPECPISPSVFETLEKKYGEQKSWRRSARRLLFDRINSGLMEILQPCLGEPMWAKLVARRFSFRQDLKALEKQLYTFLVSQEKETVKHSSEKVLAKDDGWLFLGYEIEVIGKEIENSLIDELVAEIVSIESF